MIRTVIKYTDNKVLLNDAEVFETSKTLMPGVFDMEFDQYGAFKNYIQLRNQRIYPLFPSDELENIESYINIFLSEEYKKFCNSSNISVRTGILLYGDAGIGKSNYINYLIDKAINKYNACCFSINDTRKAYNIATRLRELRDIQDNLFIVILEEMDELLADVSIESVLKNLMDGIDSVDNCLFLGSTNYIDKIPKSLIERPSRFKKVVKIKQTDNQEVMKEWLVSTYKVFIPDISKEDCDKFHDVCINKTVDEIKHILIDHKMGITKLEQKKKLGFKA